MRLTFLPLLVSQPLGCGLAGYISVHCNRTCS